MRRLLLLLALAPLAACVEDSWLIIEPGAAFSGTVTVGDQVTQASGPASGGWEHPLLQDRACWEFRKTDSGSAPLVAYVTRTTLLGPEQVGYDETTQPGGVVRGCS